MTSRGTAFTALHHHLSRGPQRTNRRVLFVQYDVRRRRFEQTTKAPSRHRTEHHSEPDTVALPRNEDTCKAVETYPWRGLLTNSDHEHAPQPRPSRA